MGKQQRHKQAHALHGKGPQPPGQQQLARILHEEEIGSLHVKVIPVRKHSLGHALPYQTEKGRVLPHIVFQQGGCGKRTDGQIPDCQGSQHQKPDELIQERAFLFHSFAFL